MRVAIAMLSLLGFLAGCASPGLEVRHLRNGEVGWITYPSSKEPMRLRGELVIPDKAVRPAPVMIIVHASGGRDGRNIRWARFLQEHGIATFDIDYFGPRGVRHDSAAQPLPVHDVLDAFRLLATHPKVDPDRIGAIGFSRGADLALMAANTDRAETGGRGMAAHVGLYPMCFPLIPGRKGSGGAILVLAGELDELVKVSQCERFADLARADGREVSLKVYPGAHHAWDGDFNRRYYHRAINRTYTLRADASVTEQSRKDVLEFLRRVLQL